MSVAMLCVNEGDEMGESSERIEGRCSVDERAEAGDLKRLGSEAPPKPPYTPVGSNPVAGESSHLHSKALQILEDICKDAHKKAGGGWWMVPNVDIDNARTLLAKLKS